MAKSYFFHTEFTGSTHCSSITEIRFESFILRKAFGGWAEQMVASHRLCTQAEESLVHSLCGHCLERCVMLQGPHRMGWLFGAYGMLSSKDEPSTHL